jgi:endonuclease/exonuclease/phosphatase family metal-dependent hydrolase
MTTIFLCLSMSLLTVAAADEAPGLAVMSYNIHHAEGMDGKIDLDRIAAVVLESGADIVCFQEVDKNLPRTAKQDMPALLGEKLKMECIFGPNYYFDGGEYGNAIATRLPVLKSYNTALPNPTNKEPRGCLSVTVEWQGHPVEILCTHLGLTGLERLSQAQAIAALPGDTPHILAGDMNERITAPGMKLLSEQMQAVVLIEEEPVVNSCPTPIARTRIDLIFASSDLDILSSKVIQDERTKVASDHFPCIASFKLKLDSEEKN